MNSSLYDCHSCTNESNISNSSASDNYCPSNNTSNTSNSSSSSNASNYSCINTSSTSINNFDTVSMMLKSLENDLCDMKVTLAETKATLIFLAQTLCNKGNLCSIEKTLLLNIEQSLKNLNCKINESRCNVDGLSNIL